MNRTENFHNDGWSHFNDYRSCDETCRDEDDVKMSMQQPSFINLVFVKRLYNDGIVM